MNRSRFVRGSVCGLVGLAASLGARPAAADGPSFGARAHTVLVLDNVAGAINSTYGTPDDPTELGITTVGTGGGLYAYNVVTRFGVHQFITDTVSLGGGIHWSDRGATLESFGGSATIIALSPRVGFAVPLSDVSAFWFRVGGTYMHVSYGDVGHSHDLMLGGELYYVYTPVEHFGITVGPVVEIGVAGSLTQTSRTPGVPDRSADTRRRMFGLGFGFLFDL